MGVSRFPNSAGSSQLNFQIFCNFLFLQQIYRGFLYKKHRQPNFNLIFTQLPYFMPFLKFY